MSDTALRYLAMLSMIPKRPHKVAARDLHRRLGDEGFNVDVRSIERDLHKLSLHYPLANDASKPAGWWWSASDKSIRLPNMDATTALTYELLARYLAPIFPRSMLQALEPEFAAARSVLNKLPVAPVARWSRRIAVLPFGQQLLPPQVNAKVRDVVHDALLRGCQFVADYRSVSADKPRRYTFNPLGLVYRMGVLYLVATLNDFGDPRHFALQRMSKAEGMDTSVQAPPGFDFERYVREEKSFDYPVGDNVRLELRVESWLGHHLEESRLAEDQKVTAIRDSDEYKVTASVANTDQLFWWLRSLGASVEVIKPAALRRRMSDQAKELAGMYN